MSHTPTPWSVDEPEATGNEKIEIWAGGVRVADICGLAYFDFENARLIVRAVNAFEPMREALRDLMNMREKCFIPNENNWWDDKAKEALALADKEKP